MFKRKMIMAVVFVAAMEFVSSSALAQTSRETQNRIQRLENEIQTLSRAVYRGDSMPSPVSSGAGAQNNAAMEVRLQGLEQQIRSLTGAVERKSYETQQLQQSLDRFQNDVSIRLQDLEAGNAGQAGFNNSAAEQAGQPAPSSTQRGMQYIPPQPRSAGAANAPKPLSGDDVLNAPSGNVPPPPSLGQLTLNNNAPVPSGDAPTALYETGFAQLRAGDHDQAERTFNDFIKSYPNHTLAGNAEYWRAETHYVRGDFNGAARLFAQAYQKFPDGQKAPDNLLKLGLSLAGLGNNDDACIALDQLQQAYGKKATPVTQRGQQEMSRLGC